MTEVPEHLLQKAREARARLTGAPLPDVAPTETPNAPAVVDASTPAPAAKTLAPMPADPPVPPAPPEAPWVTASKERKKIPAWVMPVLLFLPVWAFMYVGTTEEPTRVAPVIALGGEIYESKCASCHGVEGGGGTGPAFSGGAIIETFAHWEDQVEWVVKGTEGFAAEGRETYGTSNKAVGGSGNLMPAFAESLNAEELTAVIFYERVELGGHEAEEELAEVLYEAFESGEISLTDFSTDASAASILEALSTESVAEVQALLVETAAE